MTRRPQTSWDAAVLFILSGAHLSLAGCLAWRDRAPQPLDRAPPPHHLGVPRIMTTPRHTLLHRHVLLQATQIPPPLASCRRPSPPPRPVHGGWRARPDPRPRGAAALARARSPPRHRTAHRRPRARRVDLLRPGDAHVVGDTGGTHPLLSAGPHPAGRPRAGRLPQRLRDATWRGAHASSSRASTRPTRPTPNGWRSFCGAPIPRLLRVTITSSQASWTGELGDAATRYAAVEVEPVRRGWHLDRPRRRRCPRGRPSLRRQRRHDQRPGLRRRLSRHRRRSPRPPSRRAGGRPGDRRRTVGAARRHPLPPRARQRSRGRRRRRAPRRRSSRAC